MNDETPQIKKGIYTSEFWMSVAANIFGAIMASGAVCSTEAEKTAMVCKILGGAIMILSTLGYTYSRTQVKK